MKTIKFVSGLILIIMLLTPVCLVNAATIERSITITDDIDDVIDDSDLGPANYPNIDIAKGTCVQTDKRVDIELRLVENGNFEKALDTYYAIVLVTTSSTGGYFIMYGGIADQFKLLLFPEAGIGDVLVMGGTSLYSEEAAPIDVISESVVENILSVSFYLDNSYERVLAIAAETAISPDNVSSYSDQAPNDYLDVSSGDLVVNAGGNYFADPGKTIQLQGNLEEGNPTDYQWLWVFDDSLISLEERNPTYKFNIPGDYLGTLFAFDDEGNWGSDIFTVTVNETGSSNGGGNNTQPGFELVVVIGAIAIALVILKRKK